MNDITTIKLKPVFQQKIWGGRRLEKYFGNLLPTGNIGECWLISAHPNGDTIVDGGPLDGMPLSQVYRQHKHLFGNSSYSEFPLIIKIIDASDDLSVQVHPDDNYAHTIGQPYGKEEAWLILEPSIDRMVQLGHYAQSKEQLSHLITNGEWKRLLKYYPIAKNDLVPVKPGTLHAILKGTMILEIQQSSDTTYRLYDYDRLDDAGNKRPLHIKESIEVISVPDPAGGPIHIQEALKQQTAMLWSGHYFSIHEWNVTTQMNVILESGNFYLLTILSGTGTINGVPCQMGDAVIITSLAKTIDIKGKMRIVTAIPAKGA
ncbi:MAG TPA: class I mannose-6-phosphate isomerase [Bacilli bacterium]|nr:class I mannose-6-phosphate isomerase [Bacilli bacterium]